MRKLLEIHCSNRQGIRFDHSLKGDNFYPLCRRRSLSPLIFRRVVNVPMFRRVRLTRTTTRVSRRGRHDRVSFRLELRVFAAPVLRRGWGVIRFYSFNRLRLTRPFHVLLRCCSCHTSFHSVGWVYLVRMDVSCHFFRVLSVVILRCLWRGLAYVFLGTVGIILFVR